MELMKMPALMIPSYMPVESVIEAPFRIRSATAGQSAVSGFKLLITSDIYNGFNFNNCNVMVLFSSFPLIFYTLFFRKKQG